MMVLQSGRVCEMRWWFDFMHRAIHLCAVLVALPDYFCFSGAKHNVSVEEHMESILFNKSFLT